MIKNNKQLNNSQKELEKLLTFITESEGNPLGKNEILHDMESSGVKSLISSLKEEIGEYLRVKNESSVLFENISVADLSKILIYARIAEGISQEELANRIGTKQQQINRYESTDYEAASLSRILDIVDALKVDLSLAIKMTKPIIPELKNIAFIGDITNERIVEFQKEVVKEGRLLRA